MTARVSRWLAPAAIAMAFAVAPARASAFEWTGNVGLLYDRSDLWPEGGLHSYQPRLDVDLRLDLRGDVGGRGLFEYGGFASYLWSTRGSDVKDKQNTLTYHADAVLFGHSYSPFRVTAFAERFDTRYETTGTGPLDRIGDRVTDRYGGSMRLVGTTTPSLELGYDRLSFDEQVDSTPFRTRTKDQLTARVHQSVAAYGLGATYLGNWSDGTFVSDQFTSQEVHANGRVNIAPYTDLTVSDRYYQRDATSTAPDAFNLQSNAFFAAFRAGRLNGERTLIRYTNRHSLSTTGVSLDETTGNSLNALRDFPIGDSRFFVRGVADVSSNEQRTALVDLRSRGGTIGPELWWRTSTRSDVKVRKGVMGGTLYELSGGPLLAFLQQTGAADRWGYGAVARASATIRQPRRQIGALYEVTYGTDLFGQPGWLLQQNGTGSIGGPAGTGTYSLQATLTSRRAFTPLLGDEAQRTISVLGSYAWWKYTVNAQFLLSDGVAPGTEGFVGDGVFIPLGFNAHSMTGLLGGSVAIFPNLVLRADARYGQTRFPGQPDLSVAEANGALFYSYGAFSFSVEERLTRSDDGNVPFTRNAVFVRVTRAFGSL